MSYGLHRCESLLMAPQNKASSGSESSEEDEKLTAKRPHAGCYFALERRVVVVLFVRVALKLLPLSLRILV